MRADLLEMAELTNTEIVDGFLVNCRRRYLRESTVKAYDDRLATLLTYLDDRALEDVGKNDIELWLDAHSRCAQSRHSYRSTLVQLFDWLIAENGEGTNTARLTAKPRVPKGKPRPLPTPVVAVAIGQASPRLRAVLCLAAYAGLRCFEIAKLRVQDVNLPDRRLLVADGKGGKSRTVPIHPELADALVALPLMLTGPVIVSNIGTGYRARDISNMVRRHLHRLEIEGSAHRFRHWFATASADAGADLLTVKELLGHVSVSTTEGYVQWNSARGVSAVDAIPRAG